MVPPDGFRSNSETLGSNAFQTRSKPGPGDQLRALNEFQKLVDQLTERGVNVTVPEADHLEPGPDRHFPNNWLSTHEDGTVVLYPMMSAVRRKERNLTIIDGLRQGFKVARVINLSHHELEGRYLEGTGSLVLDRCHKVAYACLSPRTDKSLVSEFCQLLGYQPFVFQGTVADKPVYHTNVMLSVGRTFAVASLDCVEDRSERKNLVSSLETTGHEVLPIDEEQLRSFSGNMLQLSVDGGHEATLVSATAWNSLRTTQKKELETFGDVIVAEVPTIEKFGGGSVRCMIAEIFLP